MDFKNKKILVTGGNGFLGKHIIEQLVQVVGVERENIFAPRKFSCDLREKSNCIKAVTGQDIVIHLAATDGGVRLKKENPAELFYDNAIMGIELLNAAYKQGVEKFVIIGTICSYPKFANDLFKESDFWNGYLEDIDTAYGMAKKMLLIQAQTYRQQFGFHAIYLICTNLYGPGDILELNRIRVIPLIIKKIADAQSNNQSSVEFKGNNMASREFLFVEDAAKGTIIATQNYNEPEPINLGSDSRITIGELAILIGKLMDFKGEIKWINYQTVERNSRHLDISNAEIKFGFRAQTSLKEGLRKTIDWFRNIYQ